MFASKLQLATSFICNLQVFLIENMIKYVPIISYWFQRLVRQGPAYIVRRSKPIQRLSPYSLVGLQRLSSYSLVLRCFSVVLRCLVGICFVCFLWFPLGSHRVCIGFVKPMITQAQGEPKKARKTDAKKNTSKTSSLQFPLQNRGGWHPQFCRVSLRPCFATKSKTIGWQMPKNP